MKKIVLIVTLCLAAFVGKSQNQASLFSMLSSNDNDTLSVGWYAQGTYRYFYNDEALHQGFTNLVGGKVGIVVDHNLYFALTGYAKVRRTSFDTRDLKYGVSYGYGGLYAGYAPFSSKVIHPSVGISAGYGGALEYVFINNNRGATRNTAGFMYFEPELNLEVNLSNWTRLSFGVAYRFIDYSNFNFANDKLNGFDTHVSLIIGKF